ncbi:hypothetical protein GEV33_004193 [Tenebrio molitor]|uniref:Uncharacterized protein n=1 Tax=Tenebrio molitor TaxID=7067 RepID=A0A8J6HS24_TENMO|nr:hypothetical protein GEV33_004193 [Tenebrio molitor]
MIHKTQTQHNNHYTESIPTPRLQLPSTHLSRIALIHEEMEKNFLICEMLQQKISMWASTLCVALTDVENTPYPRSRPANPQADPLQNVRTFLQPSEQFEQKDHRMLHASIKQRLQTNLTEQKTLWTPTRRICTIQHEDYILQESALHSLQKRRKLQGRDIREFPASTQNKTQCPEGSPRNGPNVFAEGQFGIEDDTQISNRLTSCKNGAVDFIVK